MSMKQLLILLIVVLGSSLSAFSQTDSINNVSTTTSLESNSKDYTTGLIAYKQGDYYRAIELLQSELANKGEEGLESPVLFYNLGNAYYKVNNLGKARLYYEKALLLKPNFEDAKFNIGFIENKIQNSVSLDSNFFIQNLFKKLSYTESSNTWNVIAIVVFILFLANVGVFFFTQSELIKKVVFYVGLFFLTVCIICNVFSYQLANDIRLRNEAIVTVSSVVVFTAPDSSSAEVTILNEASKVKVTKDDKTWVEVKLSDGNVGWIQSSSIEII